ncbi:MAG: ABC transporter substrate-binding protein [Lachnospiraceae bacterium]|nr:ABC transporter substrate-binding protein [Lachnospiraceae bacterium]MBQ9643605.1 ABC transporter substrate-binding protein [Lachnospiraceae bacterium]
MKKVSANQSLRAALPVNLSGAHNRKGRLFTKLAALMLVLVMAAGLTACGNAAGQNNAAGAEFVYGLPTEVNNFDPFTATTADAKSIYFNIYEGLVKVTSDGTFAPAIAESYTVSDDAQIYTFVLRDGVKFHNGQALTMDDVLYSIQLAIDSSLNGFDNIESYEAQDDKTLVITLKEGSTDFLAMASQAIVPKDSDNNGELALAPIGTGPFKFTEYEVQDHVTLTRNDDYYGTPAKLQTVVVKFIASSSDLLVNFQSGAIDGFTANGGITEQLDKETMTINVSNSNAVQLLALNNAVKPFDDVRVRQALCYAVDANEIIDTVNYGYGVKVGSALIPGLSAYYDDSLVNYYGEGAEVEKAKELLAEAGYPDGFSFTIKVPSNYQVHVDSAQVIVNQLKKIGVEMKIEQVDWATWLEKVYSGRDYEATIISLDGAIASPTAFLSRYVSDAHNNFVNFNSPEYDEAYDAAVAQTDQDQRIADFKKAQQILTQEAASVYIEDISYNLVYSKKFTGFAGYPLYATDFAAISPAE